MQRKRYKGAAAPECLVLHVRQRGTGGELGDGVGDWEEILKRNTCLRVAMTAISLRQDLDGVESVGRGS